MYSLALQRIDGGEDDLQRRAGGDSGRSTAQKEFSFIEISAGYSLLLDLFSSQVFTTVLRLAHRNLE